MAKTIKTIHVTLRILDSNEKIPIELVVKDKKEKVNKD